MNRSKPHLIAGAKALEAAGIAIGLATRVPAPLKSIADQVVRAASSVAANLAEGDGRTGRDRIHHWRIAYASAKEVDCHLRLLLEAGAVDRVLTTKALDLFDEVRGGVSVDEYQPLKVLAGLPFQRGYGESRE